MDSPVGKPETEALLVPEQTGVFVYVIPVIALFTVTVCELEPVVSATVNSLPHSGIFEELKDEFSPAKSDGSDDIEDTHHPVRSWLNAVAWLNIGPIKVTLEVFQPPIFWSNAYAALNIDAILVTFEVFQLPIFWLNNLALLNISPIFVTLEVFQPPIFWLNDCADLNICPILVT